MLNLSLIQVDSTRQKVKCKNGLSLEGRLIPDLSKEGGGQLHHPITQRLASSPQTFTVKNC